MFYSIQKKSKKLAKYFVLTKNCYTFVLTNKHKKQRHEIHN